MKKLISIGLILLIIMNTFGFNILIIYMLQVHRAGTLELIDENPKSITSEGIRIFSMRNENLYLLNSREIIYNNEMYDIISRVNSDKDILFYCVNDKKDTKLHCAFCSLNEIKDNPVSTSNHLAVNILKNLLKNYLPYPDIQFHENNKEEKLTAENYLSLPSIILCKIYPPPEIRS